jgi:hypothetical protein
MRFADFDGDGRDELIVSPLHGRGNRGPEFTGAGVRTLRYKIPADPTKQENWQPEVINDDVHVSHNIWPTDLNRDGKLDLLIASFDGVSLLEQDAGKWKRTLIGSGNQETKPNRGSSEIKHGKLPRGGDAVDYLATIEPWHGFQVVTYTRGKGTQWDRQMLDDELAWGHAVWCANLDGDNDEELIIGVRDNKEPHRCGVRIYDPQLEVPKASTSQLATAVALKWQRHLIDPGGVAVEDLAAADLNEDGAIDIVAAGRATKNVKVYWNENKTR